MRISIIIVLFICLFQLKLSATHIIGGEITYSCLGNNQYEVTLTVYRDCYNGVPPFDDTVSIGVFNFKNDLIKDIRIPYMEDDTIKQTLIGNCKVIPPNVCVHTSRYRDTIDLKPILGGYTLVYQRCCRNKTIANIVKPDETGASFIIQISEKALLECNSCAKFKNWPPIYICANEPILFDHSAYDPDGDSIVYKLCTPTNGLLDNPQPQPPSPPPYDKVVWKDPPYNISNLMGGVPLAINSKTGLLTGVPNTIGQFVVGICIEEYRDGKLISTTTRDFQYNVGLCGKTASSFFAPDVNCDALKVVFTNQSQNANQFFWDFGDPTTQSDISNVYNPSYTYPDTGSYTVRLISQADEMCRDTFYKTIKVYKNSLIPDYKIKLLSCTDSMVVAITDASIDTLNTIVSWKYYFSIGGVLKDSSTLKNPVFVGDTLGIWGITLIVENDIGCEKSKKRNIVFPKMINFNFPLDTVYKCFDKDIVLNGPKDSTYNFTWTPGQFLSDSFITNPVCSTPLSKLYTLKIKDKSSICNITRSLYVEVAPIIQLNLPDTILTCDNKISLTVSSNVQLEKIYFSFDKDFSKILDSSYQISLKDVFGMKTLYVWAKDSFGCENLDSVLIIANGIQYKGPDDLVLCPGDTALVVVNINSGQNVNIVWEASPYYKTNGFSADVFPTVPGLNKFYYELSNDLACLTKDSFEVFVPDLTETSFVSYGQCEGTNVVFNGSGINAAYLHWLIDTGDSLIEKSAIPFIVHFPKAGNYTVKAWIPGLDCFDTLSKIIHVEETSLQLAYDLNVLQCKDSLEIVLINNSTGYNAMSSSVSWHTSFGDYLNVDSLKFLLNQNNPDFSFTLKISQNNGCMDSLNKSIPLIIVPTIPNDTIKICSGKEVLLKYNQYSEVDFKWTPAFLFSKSDTCCPTIAIDSSVVATANISSNIDGFVCNTSFQVDFIALESPLYILKYDSLTCDSSTLLSISTESSNSVRWYEDPDFSTLLSSMNNVVVMPERNSFYYGIVSNSSGCVDTFKLNIKRPIPAILPDPAVLCAGDTSFISYINLISEDSLTCTWSPSDKVFIDPVTGNWQVTAEKSFDLTLTCTNQFGCSSQTIVPVQVFEYNPPLDVSAVPDTISIGQTSQLLATNDLSYSYIWTPASTLSSTTIFNPIANPLTSTVYTVKIVNEDGCRNEASLLVVVVNPNCEEPFQFIPNAFSPNGDNKNDKFYVRGEFIESLKLSIYNRWGQMVFYTEDKNQGWDGNFKGQTAAQDVYGYQVEFVCADGKRYYKKGNVSLIR